LITAESFAVVLAFITAVMLSNQGDNGAHSNQQGDNGLQDVEYGFQDTRRRTSYDHRGSSSLTPRQIMECKDHISMIYYLFDRALDYLQSMVYFQAIFTRLRLFVRRLEGMMGENLARAAENAREMMTSIQAKFDEMEVLLACIMALAEIAYLYVEDLTVFIHRRNRLSPKQNRRLDDISGGECYNWFGQNHTNMHLLILHLRIPLTFTTPTGVVYTGEECRQV
jgi:hypothetical protein